MLKVGLSGNRYAGKDAVSRLFEQIRVPVFDADIVLKFILNYNFEINYIHEKGWRPAGKA